MNDKWDVRFINLARHIAQWSKDPSTKTGAVIVDSDRRIVSVGYNGFAMGCDDSLELYTDRDYKYETVIHCEMNAIISAKRDLFGNTLYLTSAGCGKCTAQVIQAGIRRIVIPCKEEDPLSIRRQDWDLSFQKSRDQLASAGVTQRVLEPTGFDATTLIGPEHPAKKGLA